MKTEAILRNGPGQEGILISAGRFEAKDLAPGATKTFSFIYEVGPEFRGDDYQLELMVGDTRAGRVGDRQDQDQGRPGSATRSSRPAGTVTVARADVPLREAPAADALVVGKRPRRRRLQGHRQGRGLHPRRARDGPAGLRGHQRRAQAGGTAKPSFSPVAGDPAGAGGQRAHRGQRRAVHVKGLVTDDVQVKDLFVRVFNRDSKMPAKKVFYLPNRGEKNKLPFQTDVPLWPGSNIIQVFARETNEIQSVATLMVLQKSGPSVVQAPAATEPAARRKRPPELTQ